MILEKSQNEVSLNEFQEMAYYFGIAIQSLKPEARGKYFMSQYTDIDRFFLSATYNLKSSRLAEGFLCWLVQFGHLLSPSKIRRLIKSGQDFDSAILGAFIEFMTERNIMSLQWKIIKPFCRKHKSIQQFFNGPTPRFPAPYFKKYGILAPNFKIELDKFIIPVSTIFKNCPELKNRALFGSAVNADVVSYLAKHPGRTAYQTAKATCHHKARVFEIYPDILSAVNDCN